MIDCCYAAGRRLRFGIRCHTPLFQPLLRRLIDGYDSQRFQPLRQRYAEVVSLIRLPFMPQYYAAITSQLFACLLPKAR